MADRRVKQLQHEANWLLNQPLFTPMRALHLKPTLSEIQSCTFSDYVEREVIDRADGADEVVADDGSDTDSNNNNNNNNYRLKARDDNNAQNENATTSVVVSSDSSSTSSTQSPIVQEMETTRVPDSVVSGSIPEEEEEDMMCRELDSTSMPPRANYHANLGQQQGAQRQQKRNGLDGSETVAREWNRGIAKVTLPKGFWDEAGIAYDRTARGPKWQQGTALGDLIVRQPIQQLLNGIGGVYEYTLLEKPEIPLWKFREQADKFERRQLGQRRRRRRKKEDEPDEDDDQEDSDEYWDVIATRFWKRLGPTMESPLYGADMEGSLFGVDENASGWALEHLDNCLKLLDASDETRMPGVTTPYLYVGMFGSVFCAHTEDMDLLSINYLHSGAPKYWYAIAPVDAKRFESLCDSHFSHAHRNCKEYLRHKQSLLSPVLLKQAGIMYETTIQRPGDAVITYPGAYHFGVNLGFNVAEATNFAVREWVSIGRQARICMCRPSSVRMDMQKFEALLKQYDKDAADARMLGFPQLTYQQWAKLAMSRNQKRKREKEQRRKETKEPQPIHVSLASSSASDIVSSTSGAGDLVTSMTSAVPCAPTPDSPVPKRAVSFMYDKDGNVRKDKVWITTESSDVAVEDNEAKKNGFWIEVLSPVVKPELGGKKSLKKKHSKKRKSPDEETNGRSQLEEEWRLAKPFQSRTQRLKIIKPGAELLCLVPAKSCHGKKKPYPDEREDEVEECFVGQVTEISEGSARLHFCGLSKQEDVWMSLDSTKLFMDGGKWVDPCTEKKALPDSVVAMPAVVSADSQEVTFLRQTKPDPAKSVKKKPLSPSKKAKKAPPKPRPPPPPEVPLPPPPVSVSRQGRVRKPSARLAASNGWAPPLRPAPPTTQVICEES